MLSRDSVIDGNLETELIGRNADQLEERRLNRFFSSGRNSRPNPIFPLIENAIVTAFSDSIEDGDAELLKKCYVSTLDRAKFDSRVKMHLSKREPLFAKAPKRPMDSRKHRGPKTLAGTLQLAQNASKPLALLILGPVGVGKTTFLNYTRKVTSAEFFEKRKDIEYPHWIDIDFREHAQSEKPIDFIVQKILDYFKDDSFFSSYDRAIRSAYKRDFDALRSGPFALLADDKPRLNDKFTEIIERDLLERTPYVEKLLKYAVSKVPVFIVIDNVDQFEDELVQSNIFSDAIAFAQRIGLNLIISMRESTFVRHRRSPKFDAFDFDPIQLEPPQIRQVLSRRFFVAERLLDGKSGEFVARNGAAFEVADLSTFVAIVKSSVLGTEVGDTIEMLSANDVRLALGMTRGFLERGYTEPDKALRFRQSGMTYILPKHEALRAILVGNQPVYSEEYSIIGNIFDARVNKTGAEPLRIFILGALVKLSSDRSFDYESGIEMREVLRSIGFSDEHVLAVLSDLCEMRFLHTASHGPAEFNANFYPTRLAGYLLRILIGQFSFVENMLMDTFIPDKKVWQALWDTSQSIRDERDLVERLSLRIDRVQTFFDYMLDLYQPVVEEARRRGLPSEWCGNPLEEIKEALLTDCERAKQSAERNYGRQ